MSRQARRGALCMGLPRRENHRIAISPRRLAMTAEGDHLVRVAERIADELEVTPEIVERLLPVRPAALTLHRGGP